MRYFLVFILLSFPALSPAFAQYVPYPDTKNDNKPAGYSDHNPYMPKENRPAYGDNGSRVGSYGYNGQRYLPAIRDPNPPPNLYLNQRRNPYER